MTTAKGHILPFFIPHLGCPHQCCFCNQHAISGQQEAPRAEAIQQSILEFHQANPNILPELAYYGGSFTALLSELQEYYLEPAYKGLQQQMLCGIRVSTRPDAIDGATMDRLKRYGVTTVELGVQSMNDTVLQIAGRGHSAHDSMIAVKLLKEHGFSVGVQLMPGLPGETRLSVIKGADKILRLKPHLARIYPAVVVEHTKLAKAYTNGEWLPLSMEEAVWQTMAILLLCQHYGVRVIRMGLQPSTDLEKSLLAGPYHPAFGSMVHSLLWREMTLHLLKTVPNGMLQAIYVNPKNISKAVGQDRQNIPFYQPCFGENIKKMVRGKALPLDMVEVVFKDGGNKQITVADFRQKWLGEQCGKMGFSLL